VQPPTHAYAGDVGLLRIVLNVAWLVLVGWASALTFAVGVAAVATLLLGILPTALLDLTQNASAFLP